MVKKKRSAAEASVPVKKPRTRDPMQGQTSTAGKRAGTVKKGGTSRTPTDRAQCTAHKRNGDRCSNPPVRGAKVCRMHGGSAPQVKAKANQRLIEMILPALAQLRKIIDSPNTSDADRIKAINAVLNRTGYSERQQIDIGLREPTPWDGLEATAFTIVRGTDNVTVDDALPHPERESIQSGDADDDEALAAMLDQRRRAREREAETHMAHGDHDVVEGEVLGDGRTTALFGYPMTRAEREAASGYPTEFDPEGHGPEGEPFAAYERKLRDAVEDREP